MLPLRSLTAIVALIVAPGLQAASWRWSELTPSGERPPARRNGSAIHDAAGNRIVVFGGSGASGPLNDPWAFDLPTRRWTRLVTTGGPPEPRLGHDAVYDPAGRRMIVWAGQQGSRFFNDTWVLDLVSLAWSEVTPASRPKARYGSASVFDPVAQALVTFAGFTEESRRFQDTQAFSLDGPRWTDLMPAGAKPVERCLHTAALRREARQMVIYGGQRSGALDDLWTFDLDARTWTQRQAGTKPAGRYFASSFTDSDGRFYVFGGATAGGNSNELWSFDFDAGSWTRLDVPGAPSPRNGAMGAFVEAGQRFVVFGGNGGALLDDVWELTREEETPAAAWLLPSAARLPGAGGSFYTTALELVNAGAAEARLTLKFLGHDADGTAGPEKAVTLAAGRAIRWNDLLGELFGVTQDFGAVRVASSTSSLVVVAETSTPGTSGGTFGQAVPGVGEGDLVRAGVPRTIPAVREDAAFRTNLILANATGAPLDVDVAFVSSDGQAVASRRYVLPPLGMTQVSRVLLELGAPAGSTGFLVLSTPTDAGAFAAYAAAIDNVTNDPRTLLPR